MSNIALILIGGVGARMHQDIPKQFLTINDRPIVIYTLEVFQQHPEVDEIVAVCLEGWEQVLKAYANQFNITKLTHIVKGGETAHDSALNGLKELKKFYNDDDIVLIHDGNRPLVSADIISMCILTTQQYGTATPASPCFDSMMEIAEEGISRSHYPRNKIVKAQTPNGFFLGKIWSVYKTAEEKGITTSRGPSILMMDMGEPVHLIPGSEKNFKITTTEDIEIFKALLTSKKTEWLK